MIVSSCARSQHCSILLAPLDGSSTTSSVIARASSQRCATQRTFRNKSRPATINLVKPVPREAKTKENQVATTRSDCYLGQQTPQRSKLGPLLNSCRSDFLDCLNCLPPCSATAVTSMTKLATLTQVTVQTHNMSMRRQATPVWNDSRHLCFV